ncbi:MAG: sulfite oxidase heme-binding subunit YedZ [Anaerolineales bacterium]
MSPAVLLVGDWLGGRLSVNPIQEAIQRSGRIAITLLVLTLAVRPLAHWLKWKMLLTQRRTLGLYTFAYALLHASLFLALDYRFALILILQEFVEKPYLWFGVSAFAILLPLAVTSFRYWMRKLGKNWKRLHRLIYGAAFLAVFHYGGAVKGDFLALRGEVLRPWLYGLVVALLLAWRVWGCLRKRLEVDG